MSKPPAPCAARYFIVWNVAPCIVIGRNQIAEAEIDLAEAASRNVAITRRSSGGGAVYQDPNTIQYSIIQPYLPGLNGDAMQAARRRVAGDIAEALRSFGIPAVVEGRNDITAGGAKVSGISQIMRGGWLNTHGTLLYDTDLDILAKLLKPDTDKFISKAVQSVRRRVQNVKPLIAPKYNYLSTVDVFIAAFKAAVLAGAEAQGSPLVEYAPSPCDMINIHKIRSVQYANPSYTFQVSPPYTFRNSRRFPQGRVEVFVEVIKGQTISCAIRGDFIGGAPVETLEHLLRGIPFQMAEYSAVLSDDIVANALGGINKQELLNIIFA